jgi:acetyl esterase/lipase
VVVVLPLVLALALTSVCLWIVVPPPNGPAIVASVAAIELSPYLLIANVLVLIAAWRSHRRWRVAAVAAAAVNIVLCACPIVTLISSGIPLRGVFSSPPAVEIVESSIPFRMGGEQTSIRAYLPRAGKLNPIVFAVYGGAWQHGTPNNDASLNRALASRGYAVFALDYRHAPEHRFPDALVDVRSEVGYLLAHAAEYRADPARAAILGHSSGGEMAELSVFEPDSRFRALISYSGAVDLTQGYEVTPKPDPIDVRSVIVAYMGDTPVDSPQRYQAASPIDHVRDGLPPTLLIYGDRDHVVDFRSALRLRDALAAHGDDVTLLTLPWTEHGFEDVPWGLHAPVALAAVQAFLQKNIGK